MKQQTKKLLALLVTMAMCIGLLSVPVMADGYAAKIGDTEYETVQAAISAAGENDVIVVYDASTFPQTLTLSNATIKGVQGAEKVKVDTLNMISTSNSNLTIENFDFVQTSSNGTLRICGTNTTIKNCDFEIGDSDPGSGSGGFLTMGSGEVPARNLVLENCNFDATTSNGTTFYKRIFDGPRCDNLTIKGCRFENGWSITYYGIFTGNILVEDSYLVANAYTIHNGGDTHVTSYLIKNSTLGGWTSYAWCDQSTFENCTFVDFSYNTLVAYNNTTFKNCAFPANYKIYTGTQSNYDWIIDNCTMGGELLYAGDDEKFFASDDADWKNQTVTILPVKSNAVAQIGDTKYETLAAAVAAAEAMNNNPTITLLKDTAGNGISVKSGSSFTIDFDGYTYTVDGDLAGSTGTQTQAFQLLQGSDITFKDGTITSAKALMLIQNYCNLTLDNMTLDGSNLTDSVAYTLSNNNGNVTINDSHIIAKTGGVAFDVYSFGSYTGANVTVNSGTIDGKIEVGASSGANTSNLALTINGGKFSGEFDVAGYANKFSVTGGTFVADVNDNVVSGYTLRAIDDDVYNYEVVKAVEENTDYVAAENSSATPQKLAEETVSADLANDGDTAVVVTAQKKTDDSKVFNIVTVEKEGDTVTAAEPKEITVTDDGNIRVDNIKVSALGEIFAQKVTELNAVESPTAALSLSVETETVAEDAITYEVHPVVTVAGNSYALNGEVVDGSYTFRLTVPDSMAAKFNKIKVAHGSDAPQYCNIQGEAGGYYVEAATTHFSTFEVTGVIGISAIDAYIDTKTNEGNIRFITTVNATETTGFGTYFVKDTNIQAATDLTAVDTEDAHHIKLSGDNLGTYTTFQADMINVPSTYNETQFYAISYVVAGGDTYWSVSVPAVIANEANNK